MVEDPAALLWKSLESDRVHSAYLLAGPGEAPREAALRFVRGLVCEGAGTRPCEACSGCRRTLGNPESEPIVLDGNGRKGPLYRHVGDHPDVVWVERGADDTRVRIGQVRAVQHVLRLRGGEGRRAAVIADAEWLNQEAQNALLRLLEEPPPRTTLVLVASGAAGLLATVRSRCVRVAFPHPPPAEMLAEESARELVARLGGLARLDTAGLLDWAAEYRGVRAVAAAEVTHLLEVASAWIHDDVTRRVTPGGPSPDGPLEAFDVLNECRKALAQRNANPQMVAEKALLALREAARP